MGHTARNRSAIWLIGAYQECSDVNRLTLSFRPFFSWHSPYITHDRSWASVQICSLNQRAHTLLCANFARFSSWGLGWSASAKSSLQLVPYLSDSVTKPEIEQQPWAPLRGFVGISILHSKRNNFYHFMASCRTLPIFQTARGTHKNRLGETADLSSLPSSFSMVLNILRFEWNIFYFFMASFRTSPDSPPTVTTDSPSLPSLFILVHERRDFMFENAAFQRPHSSNRSSAYYASAGVWWPALASSRCLNMSYLLSGSSGPGPRLLGSWSRIDLFSTVFIGRDATRDTRHNVTNLE
jgi:hypothetical protein